MAHSILMFEGAARTWYKSLVDDVLANHTEIPCRQGMALESPHALSIIIPAAEDVTQALAMVDLPRRGDLRQRTTFSVLYSLRRLLGYHDTVLCDRYPILARYTRPITTSYFARSISYIRDDIPAELANEPWVTRIDEPHGTRFSIDQFMRAACVLGSTPFTKRALIDFGEGFKPRCVLTWLFLIRHGHIRIHQTMRSNDLVVGLPNNIVDARIAQAVFAAITGTSIGALHHTASMMQIYRRDAAGLDAVAALAHIDHSDAPSTDIEQRLQDTPIVAEFTDIVAPWINLPLKSPGESIQRWRTIMAELESLFWRFNSSCSAEHRRCVEHILGRYAQ